MLNGFITNLDTTYKILKPNSLDYYTASPVVGPKEISAPFRFIGAWKGTCEEIKRFLRGSNLEGIKRSNSFVPLEKINGDEPFALLEESPSKIFLRPVKEWLQTH